VRLQQCNLTLKINISLNGCDSVKLWTKNACSKYWWSPDRLKTLSKKVVQDLLTLAIFAGVTTVCGRPQPEHESMTYATAVLFSDKMYLIHQNNFLSGNVLGKQSGFILYIHWLAFNYIFIFNGKSHCCNSSFTNCCWQREFNKEINYFHICRFSITSAKLPENFVKINRILNKLYCLKLSAPVIMIHCIELNSCHKALTNKFL